MLSLYSNLEGFHSVFSFSKHLSFSSNFIHYHFIVYNKNNVHDDIDNNDNEDINDFVTRIMLLIMIMIIARTMVAIAIMMIKILCVEPFN